MDRGIRADRHPAYGNHHVMEVFDALLEEIRRFAVHLPERQNRNQCYRTHLSGLVFLGTVAKRVVKAITVKHLTVKIWWNC